MITKMKNSSGIKSSAREKYKKKRLTHLSASYFSLHQSNIASSRNGHILESQQYKLSKIFSFRD